MKIDRLNSLLTGKKPVSELGYLKKKVRTFLNKIELKRLTKNGSFKNIRL